MDHDHRFPIVATVTAPPGAEAPGQLEKVVHLTVGPGLAPDGTIDPDAPQTTILWAWSAHLRRGYAWQTTTNPPVLVAGRADRWDLDLGDGLTARLVYRRSASCCGDPLKRWRPPGAGARRRGSTP